MTSHSDRSKSYKQSAVVALPHYTGRVSACAEEEVELVDAAWIADDGRFATAMAEGKYNEIEPYPDNRPVVVNRACIVDWSPHVGELPRSQK
jgi:hypothetical protein